MLEERKYAPARKIAGEPLERRPGFVPALNTIAQAHALEWQLEPAIAAARQALAIEPDNGHALSNLMRYLILGGRADEARGMVDRLMAVQPERGDVYVKKAEALSFLGEDKAVLEVYRQARGVWKEHFSREPHLHHYAAVAAARLGRESEARGYWRSALKAMPDFQFSQDNLTDLQRPPGERHAPWPHDMASWVPVQSLQDIIAQLLRSRENTEEELIRGVERYLSKHPEMIGLLPLLLELGDPGGRALALQIALASEKPELLVALRDFALGTRGPDKMRLTVAQRARKAGLLLPGLVRMWIRGE